MSSRLVVRGAFLSTVVAGTLLLGKLHAATRGMYDLSASPRLWALVTAAVVSAGVGYVLGLPERPACRTALQTAVIAALVTPIGIAIFQTIIGRFVLPRFVLIASIPVNSLIFLGFVAISKKFSIARTERERILLWCDSKEAAAIQNDFEIHSEIPCLLVGRVDQNEVLTPGELEQLLHDTQPSMVVYSVSGQRDTTTLQTLRRMHERGLRVRTISDFYDSHLGKVPIRELESSALLFDVREIHHPSYFRISRILDMAFALIGLITLGMVIPVVAFGNFVANRGPLFYAQERIGKSGTAFKILKFRTMKPSTELSTWTTEDDPRITAFGGFLRRTHLDELPQVINMIRGELSLVGPRPEQPHYVEQLSKSIPFYNARHLVRPGLTGWAQVNYPYGADETDAFEKLQFEFWYLRHQRLVIDIKIMIRTVRHVLGFKGR